MKSAKIAPASEGDGAGTATAMATTSTTINFRGPTAIALDAQRYSDPADDRGQTAATAAGAESTAAAVNVASGGVEARLKKNLRLGSVHDLYHELRLEAQAAGIELQEGEEFSKFNAEAVLELVMIPLLERIFPLQVSSLTEEGKLISELKQMVPKLAKVLEKKVIKAINEAVVEVGKEAAKVAADAKDGADHGAAFDFLKELKASVSTKIKDAVNQDFKSFKADIKCAAKKVSKRNDIDVATDTIDEEFQESIDTLIQSCAEKATPIAERVRQIGGNFNNFLNTIVAPVLKLAAKENKKVEEMIKHVIQLKHRLESVAEDVESPRAALDLANLAQITEERRLHLEGKVRAFLAKLVEQIKAEGKVIAGEIAKEAVGQLHSFGKSSGAENASTPKPQSERSTKRIEDSVDAFFEDVEKIIWGGSSSGKVNALLAAEKAGTLRAATEGSGVDSRKTSEDWQKWKDKTKEDIKVKAVGCLNELNTAAERLRTAAAGSGVANDVQSAIDAAQDQIELLLSEASGVVDDLTGQAGFLKIFLAFIGPFLVKGASSLVIQRRKNPLAYDGVRGHELFKDFPHWWRHTLLYRHLSGRRVFSAVFLIFNFLMQTWFFATYAFFIPIDQIDSNYKENTHRNPGGVNGTLKIKSQVGAWQLEGNFMLNVFFFLAFFVMPLIILTMGKLLIDTADLPLCGSMVATLESHYGGKINSNADLKANIRDPINFHSGVLFICSIVLSIMLIAGYTFHYSYNNVAWSGVMGGYPIAHMFGFNICGTLAIFTSFGALNMLLSANTLLKHNILAYRELVDLVSMQVLVQLKKERAKMPKTRTAEEDTLVMNRTCNNPLIKTLNLKLAKRERYLLAASNELLNGDIGAATNTIYALVLTSSFFFIFYVAINVIEVINNPAEATGRRITFMVGAFVAFLVGTYFLVWPIFGMAAHPQEWGKLIKSLKTSSRKEVSRTLSNSDDPEMWINHHTSLTKSFTWRLLGQEISYKAIGATMAGYLAVLWTVVLVPAISKFSKDLQLQAGFNTSIEL